jgi:hypothetical protein
MNPDADNREDIKLAINNLIWMYADGKITLEQAEKMAMEILHIINGNRVSPEVPHEKG